jgi:hypothetical protein
MPQPDGDDWGWGEDVPELFPRRGFTYGAGSGFGPGQDQVVSGLAGLSVVSIAIELEDGSSFVVRPRLAPARLRRSRPWLRHLRFYLVFFPDGPAPRSETARDSGGHVLRTGHVRAACGG